MADAARSAVAEMTQDLDFLRLAPEPFGRAPKKSIDYAVMERTKLAAVVPADMGWSDVGSWDAVWDNLDHDADGNAISGHAVVLDSRNSLVRSEDSILTAAGRDRQCGGGGDRRCRAGRCARQGGKRQGAGRPTQGAEPARGRGAPAHLSPMGLLPERRYRHALSGQAHRGEVRRPALAAEALPSRRALGGGHAAPPR